MSGLERIRERGRRCAFWGVGRGWGRLPSRLHASPTDDRSSPPSVYTLRLRLEWLDVVQQLEMP